MIKGYRLFAVAIVTGVAFLLALLLGFGQQGSGGLSATQAALYSPGGTEPGEVSIQKVERFWQSRLTYPTGRFDQRWLSAARKQAKRIKSGIPQGHYRAVRGSARQVTGSHGAQSIKALAAARPLGPQPQASSGCQAPCFTFGLVSGRVNAVAFDPRNPSVAYLAQDGGGIWKTTNCCTPFTTWTVTTDGPNVPTTATDDVTVDPNNSNVVYAATGDLSFGSFAFGSAGVLKSTDAGATWQTLGANVFTPVYPAGAGGSYPQYQAVSKVKVDPNNSNKVVAGTKTGLYFSYNGGTNWSGPCLTNSYTSQRQDITGLILRDDGATTSVYAAVGARGYGTFVQQNLGLNGANGIYKLAALPASGCPAVSSWTAQKAGFPAGTAGGVPCNPPIVPDSTTMCAASADKLGRIELAIAPSDPNVLYAEIQKIDPQPTCGALQLVSATTARGCFLGLWRTSNGGATWTQVADHSTMSFPEGTTTAGPCGEDTPQMWYDMALAVDPNNPDALFLDAIDIWKSTDGGKTLTDISCGYHSGLVAAPVHVDQHVLQYQPGSSTNLLAASDGGMYVSNNAANAPQGTPTGILNPPTFKDVNLTLNTIEFYGGDISSNFANSNAPFIVGGAQDNGSSYGQLGPGGTCPLAGGCQWSQRIGGDGFYARIEPKQGQRVFMESQNGNLQRSTTGPAGPYTAASGPWGGDTLSFIFPYKIDKFACPTTTCDHMIAGTNRVWESIDGADSWYPNSPNLTKGTLADRSFINQLDYAPTTNGNAIVGTNDGNVQYGFGMGTGTGNTATWVNVTGANAKLPNRPIQDVAISPQNALVGYAAVGGFDENTKKTPGHVFQLTCTTFCNTYTWVNKTGNLPNIPANAIAVNPNAPKQVFAGTDWGLYYTDDITATTPVWNHYQNGLPNTMIWSFSIDRGATTLAVFTRSRGAWAVPLPTASATQVTFFSDDFETGKAWTTSGTTCNTWAKTTDAHSPSTAWTSAPYADNCDTNLDSPSITLPSTANTIRLSFFEKHNSEDYGPAGGAAGCPCDYGIVQLSTDNGATYTSIGNLYLGAAPTYSQSTIPLPDSAAGKTIKVRFRFHSDANTSVPQGGWWIDDAAITAEPR